MMVMMKTTRPYIDDRSLKYLFKYVLKIGFFILYPAERELHFHISKLPDWQIIVYCKIQKKEVAPKLAF